MVKHQTDTQMGKLTGLEKHVVRNLAQGVETLDNNIIIRCFHASKCFYG